MIRRIDCIVDVEVAAAAYAVAIATDSNRVAFYRERYYWSFERLSPVERQLFEGDANGIYRLAGAAQAAFVDFVYACACEELE